MKSLLLAMVLAATGHGTATDTLKQRDQEIRAALPAAGTQVTPAARAKLEKILTGAVDLDSMARSALGESTWASTPPAKRKKFLNTFVTRFRRATGDQLDQYRGTQVTYQPEEKTESGDVRVPTEVTVKGEPTNIVYVLRQEAGAYRIVDIVVDDVSTVDNYRSSFNRIVKKEGIDGLIARLSKSSPDVKGTPSTNK